LLLLVTVVVVSLAQQATTNNNNNKNHQQKPATTTNQQRITLMKVRLPHLAYWAIYVDKRFNLNEIRGERGGPCDHPRRQPRASSGRG